MEYKKRLEDDKVGILLHEDLELKLLSAGNLQQGKIYSMSKK